MAFLFPLSNKIEYDIFNPSSAGLHNPVPESFFTHTDISLMQIYLLLHETRAPYEIYINTLRLEHSLLYITRYTYNYCQCNNEI